MFKTIILGFHVNRQGCIHQPEVVQNLWVLAKNQASLGGPNVRFSKYHYQFKKEARKVCQVKYVKFG